MSRGAVAIVLARAGSKGVPGKNSADIAGRPCVAWTIEHALNSATIERVCVSTDDERVARVAQEMGAQVVERPDELSHDTATIDDAARHAHAQIGTPDAPVVILYANVPVRPDDLSDRAVGLLVDSGCDSVQSFARVGKHHPYWTAKTGADGKLIPWEGDVLFHNCFRRQDLPEALVPDGGVMVVTPRALTLGVGAPDGPHAFLGNDRRAVVTDEGDVIDIDAPIDVVVADTILRERAVHAHR